MLRVVLPLFFICFYFSVDAQVNRLIRIVVLNDKKAALQGSTVYLLTADSVTVRTEIGRAHV